MNPLVLVVEDDFGTRKLLHALLTRHELDVDCVDNGADALELLRRIPYDVLVLDLVVPYVNGPELLAALRVEYPELLSRTIVLSSLSETKLREVREAHPEVIAIRKPFELDDITTAVVAKIDRANERRTFDLSDEFCRRSVILGAKAGIVVRTDDDARLHLATSFGYGAGMPEQWFPMDVTSPLPICVSVRNQREVWIAAISSARADYPALVPVWNEHGTRAVAAVPVVADGQVVGAVGWSFRDQQPFHEPVRRALAQLAGWTTPLLGRGPALARDAS